VLTEGFDQLGTMITWANHPTTLPFFEQLGYVTEKNILKVNSLSKVKPEFSKRPMI
jgi:hypothetical protein